MKKIFSNLFDQKVPEDARQSNPKSSDCSSENNNSEKPQTEPNFKDFEIIEDSQDDGRIFTTENKVSGWVYVSESDQKEPQQLTGSDWHKIVTQKSFDGFHLRDIYFSLYKGIDQKTRLSVWPVIIDLEGLQKKLGNRSYQELSAKPSTEDEQIVKDIKRTCQNLEYFRTLDGQTSLQKILRAYSNFDLKTGYVQGMNSIGAGLVRTLMTDQIQENSLTYSTAEERESLEELLFWTFVFIMEERSWKTVFMPNTPGLKRCLGRLKQLMKQYLPKIYQHMEQLEAEFMPGLLFDMLFIPYYFTLMLFDTPRLISQNILDLFLLDGESVIHSLLIKMMLNCREEILECNIETISLYFQTKLLQQCNKTYQSQIGQMQSLSDYDLNFFIDQEIKN